MAIFRQICTSFWTDPKVDDDFTPEDKYFFLYLMTNPHANLCGCYEVSVKQMARETGYNTESIIRLLKRMQDVHKVLEYDEETKEVLMINWYKYNWSKSPKLLTSVLNVAEYIKSSNFKKYIKDCVEKKNTVSIPYAYPMDTSESESDSLSLSLSLSQSLSQSDKDNLLSKEEQQEAVKKAIEKLGG